MKVLPIAPRCSTCDHPVTVLTRSCPLECCAGGCATHAGQLAAWLELVRPIIAEAEAEGVPYHEPLVGPAAVALARGLHEDHARGRELRAIPEGLRPADRLQLLKIRTQLGSKP